MSVQTEFIKTIPYFTGLSQAALDSLGKYIFEKRAERGEMLLFEGEPAETLYFVVDGAVKVFKTSQDGKEQILQIIRPGDSFNDVPVFSGEVNLTSAEAMGKVVLNMIKKSDLETILREYPQVAMNVIHILSQRVRQLVSLVEDLSFRQVTGRVAKMLLEYAGDGSGDRPRLTQQEMAAMIGTAREMVGRSLKSLEEDGMIKIDRHRIIVADIDALKATAGVVL
jgi:CRP/FNR family cyclic AMP-dependent transcriptional regulator